MARFFLKDLKVYNISEKQHIIAFRGSDDFVDKKDFKTIHFNYAVGDKGSLKAFIRQMTDRNTITECRELYNLRGKEDLIELALQTAGDLEEFKKLSLYRIIDDSWHNYEFDNIDTEIYEVVDEWREINIGKTINYKKCKVIDHANIFKGVVNCYANKGLRNTVKTALKKRYAFMELDDIIIDMDSKSIDKVKCQILDKDNDKLGLYKTFYIKPHPIREDSYALYPTINRNIYYGYYDVRHSLEGIKLKVFV